jgi:hypothetical protein
MIKVNQKRIEIECCSSSPIKKQGQLLKNAVLGNKKAALSIFQKVQLNC